MGVDLGDQWSHYCILGLEGETLAEGQLRTTQEDIAEFFQALNAARVVFEVGTHSPWVQEVIGGCGHEVLVANPRLMEGSKRRKRKNDRIDANKLARLGRVDPQSLHPMQHRSREVRQDLVVLRARDALVAARTELINATRGLVKSMGSRLPKCSSPSFAQKIEKTVPVELRDAARDQTVVGIWQGERGQEAKDYTTQRTETAAVPDPIVSLILGLLASPAMADDRME